MRDHLFISYATEDWPLAHWLTRRLTAEGYSVWCDRIKLLGGESYPKAIDDAIENRTWRFIALLSRSSKTKDNPLKERTKALKVGQALKIPDFVIPLNVDGVDPDWMVTDLTYVPFHHGWAAGLSQLLEKLAKANSPRPLPNGREVAIRSFLPQDVVSPKPEVCSSTAFGSRTFRLTF
jgi:TIR domain-containing protein